MPHIADGHHSKRDWLRETFGIEKIPSEATLSRVLSITDAKAVIACVVSWMKVFCFVTTLRRIAKVNFSPAHASLYSNQSSNLTRSNINVILYPKRREGGYRDGKEIHSKPVKGRADIGSGQTSVLNIF